MTEPVLARPSVAIVVPFHGSADDARAVGRRLGAIDLRAGDRVIIADNTEDQVVSRVRVPEPVEVLVCEVKRSAYAARNEAFEAVTQPWVLLLDADCHPRRDILDRFFDAAIGSDVGAVSGGVGGLAGQPGFVPAYARSRHHLDQQRLLESHVFRPMAVTANLLVRREAWASVGGFAELVASGADGDFCWRLQAAGWRLEHRPSAEAPHEHRTSVRDMLTKARRDGAANPWLADRWDGYPRRVGLLRHVVRAAGGIPVWLVLGRPRAAAFKAFDLVWVLATDIGGLFGNATPRSVAARGRTTVLLDEAPAPGDPALRVLPEAIRLEALRRPPVVQDWAAVRGTELWLAEDDGCLPRARALLRLAVRRPRGVAAALYRERRAAIRLAPAAWRTVQEGGPVAALDGAATGADVVRSMSGAGAAEVPGR